jgi:uncharacterized membrane protein
MLLATSLFVGVASFICAQTITSFDPPNSTYTIASAINAEGRIAGYYVDSAGEHGFFRKRDGTFVTFEAFPGTQFFPFPNGYPLAINTAGEITGFFSDQSTTGSFLRRRDGTIIMWTAPVGAMVSRSQTDQTSSAPIDEWWRFCSIDGTAALAMNDAGQITGGYGAGNCRGFLRQHNGNFVNFDVHSELHPEYIPWTSPQAINLLGQITGLYFDTDSSGSSIERGFLRQPDGTIIRFDPPDSVRTTPRAINLFGQIAGYYRDTNSVVHGFVRQPNGTVVTFDPSGSTDTEAVSINAEGQITGFYLGSDGTYHGFVRKRDGTFCTFDAPNSQGTFAQSINFFGQITGYYFDGSNYHGFLRGSR